MVVFFFPLKFPCSRLQRYITDRYVLGQQQTSLCNLTPGQSHPLSWPVLRLRNGVVWSLSVCSTRSECVHKAVKASLHQFCAGNNCMNFQILLQLAVCSQNPNFSHEHFQGYLFWQKFADNKMVSYSWVGWRFIF